MSVTLRSKEATYNRLAWGVSAVVLVLVLLMRRYKIDTAIDFSWLPMLYSGLNMVTFCLLLAGYYFIRVKKNMTVHRKIMQVAILSSALFLLLYVVYHFTSSETQYCGQGAIRTVYFALLITHVVLAAAILPFILLTYIRAITTQYQRHRRMARWVWPLWLYVSLSGPLVYVMLWPCLT